MTTLGSASVLIDAAGVSAPAFNGILEYLKAQYRDIYGSDVYLENDSQDGQFLGIIARCISDANSVAVSVYNAFSPATAVGDALSRNVRINGLARAVPSPSTATVILVGVSGTVISNGVVSDAASNRWLLPASVTIPAAGELEVTATAELAGAIIAPAGSIHKISTPTRGWQSVSNPAAAVIGAAVETDRQLRQRQALSVALPSQSLADSMTGAVLSVPGVTHCKVYENDGSNAANGIPGHSLAVVVTGGSNQDIARTIMNKKSLGCGLAGNTTVNFSNDYGQTVQARFYRPAVVNISAELRLRVTSDYNETIGAAIRQRIADYVNGTNIGDRISLSKIYAVIGLDAVYDVEMLQLGIGGANGEVDISLDFTQIASCSVSDIDIEVVQ